MTRRPIRARADVSFGSLITRDLGAQVQEARSPSSNMNACTIQLSVPVSPGLLFHPSASTLLLLLLPPHPHRLLSTASSPSTFSLCVSTAQIGLPEDAKHPR